MTEKDEM